MNTTSQGVWYMQTRKLPYFAQGTMINRINTIKGAVEGAFHENNGGQRLTYNI